MMHQRHKARRVMRQAMPNGGGVPDLPAMPDMGGMNAKPPMPQGITDPASVVPGPSAPPQASAFARGGRVSK